MKCGGRKEEADCNLLCEPVKIVSGGGGEIFVDEIQTGESVHDDVLRARNILWTRRRRRNRGDFFVYFEQTKFYASLLQAEEETEVEFLLSFGGRIDVIFGHGGQRQKPESNGNEHGIEILDTVRYHHSLCTP